MLDERELERLSAYLMGDLPAAEAAEVHALVKSDPRWRQASERFAALDGAARMLPTTEPELAARAVARWSQTRPHARRRWPMLGAAVAAGLALAWLAWPERSTPAVIAEPAHESSPAAGTRPLSSGTVTRYDDQHALVLERGTILTEGHLVVKVLGDSITVDGHTVVSMEPGEVLAHVTRAQPNLSPGDPMSIRIQTWEANKGQWLAGALAVVLVLDGTALAQPPGAPPRALSAGQAWTHPRPDQPPAPSGAAVRQAVSAEPQATAPDAGLAEREVNEAVFARRAGLVACFEQALKRNPKLSGRITTLLTIEAHGEKGRLKDATLSGEDSLQNPFVAACVLEQLGTVDFPVPPRGEREIQVSYPIEFQPRGADAVVAGQLLLPSSDGGSRPAMMVGRAARITVEVGDAPTVGPANAKVTVVVFGHPDCLFCRRAYPGLRQLQAEYRGRPVRFAFKLLSFSWQDGGEQVSRALVAAQNQGAFWEYLDRLMRLEKFDALTLDREASGLVKDHAAFVAERTSTPAAEHVARDLAQAKWLGVRGAPSTFVNGQEVIGAIPVEKLRKLIDDELAGH